MDKRSNRKDFAQLTTAEKFNKRNCNYLNGLPNFNRNEHSTFDDVSKRLAHLAEVYPDRSSSNSSSSQSEEVTKVIEDQAAMIRRLQMENELLRERIHTTGDTDVQKDSTIDSTFQSDIGSTCEHSSASSTLIQTLPKPTKNMANKIPGEQKQRRNNHEITMGEDIFKLRNQDTGEEYDIRDQRKVDELTHARTSKSPVNKLKNSERTAWFDYWDRRKRNNQKFWDAASRGEARRVMELLDRRKYADLVAEIDSRNDKNMTALHLASQNGHVDVVDILLDRDASIDSRENHLQTPLHLACMTGSTEAAKVLIDSGADINALDKNNSTPVHICSAFGYRSILVHMLKKEPDLTTKDSRGKTPIEVAKNKDIMSLFTAKLSGSGTDLEKVEIYQAKNDSVRAFLDRLLNPAINSFKTKFGTPASKTGNRASHKEKRSTDNSPDKSATMGGGSRKPVKVWADSHEETKILEESKKVVPKTPRLSDQKNFIDKRPENGIKGSDSTSATSNNSSLEGDERVGPHSFNVIGLLGKGSFGEVYLVEKKTSGTFYAMKVLKKNRIMGQNLVKYAKTERNVLSVLKHPFIVSLRYAFQTTTNLFLILDYCPGGDLGEHLQRDRRFSEDRARIYLAEVLLALEDLHKKNIIFRDLKPDNVVLDEDGHALLTDFGLSKEGVLGHQGARSFCGSVAYLAPEMLKRSGHGKSVDWYLLGVLFYEMLVGTPPYFTNNREKLFENIERGVLRVPSSLSTEAKSLLKGLLIRNPLKRLGARDDAEEIKAHAFFSDIDWHHVKERKLVPPRPRLKHIPRALKTDLFHSERGENSPHHIQGWSFINPEEKKLEVEEELRV
eukprot:CAMPEP_0115013506 /NCGR_PEP_ID=MMETSP0216-20121206/25454_1 /TAXON_ID=223996 /ORGANISM="Protocruzia adherens, Strain Boccale" /LENGTH=841 /DNA_ID=CAMNT_0002382929 /DNA_START=885 /DNA_END=3410 /DNA_ORIENTATION=-